MARKISEIYDSLCIKKASIQELSDWVVEEGNPGSTLDNAETLLEDLSSGSKVAWWRTWLWIFAVGSWIVEVLFDTHKSEITDILGSARVMSLPWYEDLAKSFQYGYALVWKDNQYVYETIDEGARVVKFAKASEKDGKVKIKIAGIINGVKVPIPSAQKTAFDLYIDKARPAGVVVEIVNLPADSIKVTMTIIRDRLVLAANNSLLRDASIFPITDAVKTFGDNLEFGGIMRISKLEDAIQVVEGVVDVKITSCQAKPNGGSYASVDMFYEAASGYVVMGWTESTVIYIDYVNVEVQS